MAIFSGKIITAHYIDPEYSVVELTYTGEDGNVYAHALKADPDNLEWQALLEEGWDQDKLLNGTADYKRASSASFNREVNFAARLLIEEKFGYTEDDSEVADINKQFSWDNFFKDMNNNKDEIFKFKIWAFESKKMQDVSAELKRDLRKATSLIEAIKIYDSIS